MKDQLIQVNWRATPEVKQFLEDEAERSGRPAQWLINHSVDMWRRRLLRERERRLAAAKQKK